MPSTIATFIAHPGEFFERRVARLSGPRGAGVATALSLASTLAIGAIMWLFSRRFTGTTTIDNPDYPGDQFCEGELSVTPAGCDQPATQTVEVSSLLWEEIGGILPIAFVGLLVLWVALAVALHIGASLADADGRIGQTLEVAAWGFVPTVVTTVVGGAALVAFAAQADLSTGDPETLLTSVEAIRTGVSGLTLQGIQLAGAAWQAYVWAAGLRVVHDISRAAAVTTAAVTAAVPVLLG